MKNLKYLLTPLVILVVVSCEKVKLEEHDVGKVLIGKWEQQRAGFHTNSSQFTYLIGTKQNYSIEFLEGGKLCINNAGETETYRIRRFSEQINNHYGQWKYGVYYGKEKDQLHFNVNYFGEDSIMIDKLPYSVNAPWPYNGYHVYRRVK